MHIADARRLTTLLPASESIDLTITSPPYYDQVDYGIGGQVGFGQSYPDYLADLGAIFGNIHRRTSSRGSLWIVADTIRRRGERGMTETVPLPFDLAAAAQNAGWIFQDVVIWRKDRTLPWSSRGRFRNGFEYVLFMVKGRQFKFALDRLRSQESMSAWWRRYPERFHPLGVAPTNVWDFDIPVQGSWGSGQIRHQCPLPVDLVRNIIALCSDEGDLVCDPFAGIGTVLAVASSMNRRIIGTEIVPENVAQFHQVVLPAVKDEILSTGGPGRAAKAEVSQLLARMRHAKHARVLARMLLASGHSFTAMHAAARVASLPTGDRVGRQRISVYAPGELLPIQASALDLISRPPLSKFGIESEVALRHDDAWQLPRDLARWSVLALEGVTHRQLTWTDRPSLDAPLVAVGIASQLLARPSVVNGG